MAQFHRRRTETVILDGKLVFDRRPSDPTLRARPTHHRVAKPSPQDFGFQGDSSGMLRINPLQPPRPVPPSAGTPRPPRRVRPMGFVSAEDYDATGVLAGLDPCESRYWWLAEFYDSTPAATAQATSRDVAIPPAAT